jgi:hypothetical protein
MPKALSHSDEWLFYYIKIVTTQVLFSKTQRGDMIVEYISNPVKPQRGDMIVEYVSIPIKTPTG